MKFQIVVTSLASVIVVMLVGCSTPLPMVDRVTPTGSFPFGDISSFDNIKAKFMDYYLLYTDEAQKKRINAQNASETGFYGGVFGVLGGIAKDVTAAATGAIVGAGAGLYSDRYRLQVQATNYETAADAMLCMYRANMDISNNTLTSLTIDDKSAAIATRDIALDGFIAVRGKLYKLQANFALGQPDPHKLKDAMNAPKASTGTSGVATLTTAEAAVQNLLPEYKSNIDQCVAKISG